MSASELSERIAIPAHHPCLPGHFPGHPVVPGVVLLDRVAALVERAGAGRLARIAAVKFLAPLRPDETAELRVALDGARVRFEVLGQGTPILRGEGELA